MGRVCRVPFISEGGRRIAYDGTRPARHTASVSGYIPLARMRSALLSFAQLAEPRPALDTDPLYVHTVADAPISHCRFCRIALLIIVIDTDPSTRHPRLLPPHLPSLPVDHLL
jgi:hypothetical protein